MKSFLTASKILLVITCLATGMGWQTLVHGAPDASVTKPDMVEQKININTATADEIASFLIGIGPKKAEALVDYRKQHGPFRSLEQLLEIKGIGEATLTRNADRIAL